MIQGIVSSSELVVDASMAMKWLITEDQDLDALKRSTSVRLGHMKPMISQLGWQIIEKVNIIGAWRCLGHGTRIAGSGGTG